MRTFTAIIIILFCLLQKNSLYCQQKSDKTKFLESNYAIPDNWKDESVVVLTQEYEYSYLRDNKGLVRKEVVTRKILLNDKNALSEFSTLYFRSSDNIEIQVIKPDNEIIKINSNNAVKVEESVPMFFKTLYLDFSVVYYKLAIPGLQPGDIVVFNYTFQEFIKDISHIHYFKPFKFTLSSKYPILHQKVLFNVDRGFFIAFNSYNGAPKIKQEESGVDLNGRVRANIKSYSIEDNNRENYTDQLWFNQYLYEPLIKFEVSYIPKNYLQEAKVFFDDVGTVKNKVDGNDVQELVDKIVKSESIDKFLIKKVNYYIKQNKLESLSVEESIKSLYYYLRFYYYDSYCEYHNVYSYGSDNPGRNVVFSISDYEFLRIFSKFLEELNIKYKVVAALPLNEGRLSDILLGEELSVFIKVYDRNKEYYLYPFTTYSDFNYIPPQLENQKAYEFSLFKNKKVFDSKQVTIPENLSIPEKSIKSYVNIDENLSKVEIIDTINFKANFKERYSIDYLFNYNVQKEERMAFKNFLIKETFVSNPDKEKNIAEEQQKVQIEKIKEYINSDFQIENIDTFEVISSGLNRDKENLICRQKYWVSGLINRAGPNYIFNIGTLIGSQIKLEEAARTRKNDAFLDTRKFFSDVIIIRYPEVYHIEGIEKLNVNIDNLVGHFQAKVISQGQGFIELEVVKEYKTNCIPLANWEEMRLFMDTAFDFSQLKILLKK